MQLARRGSKGKAKVLNGQRYTRRRSVAPVIRLHIGHSFVEPRQRSQQSLQQVCQQPVDTVGSLYGSKQIRQLIEVDEILDVSFENMSAIVGDKEANKLHTRCFTFSSSAWTMELLLPEFLATRIARSILSISPTPMISSIFAFTASSPSCGRFSFPFFTLPSDISSRRVFPEPSSPSSSFSFSTSTSTSSGVAEGPRMSPSVNWTQPKASSSPSISISSSTSWWFESRVWNPVPIES